jgi:hypothetical protein
MSLGRRRAVDRLVRLACLAATAVAVVPGRACFG